MGSEAGDSGAVEQGLVRSRRVHLDQSPSVAVVLYVDTPRLAADLAVLDVSLDASATGIETDRDDFPTIGTHDFGFRVPGDELFAGRRVVGFQEFTL